MTSKGVGMVRRMDELGRVVIPKEVRKSFRINNHEPLEILIDGEDTIVLRKYHSRPDMEQLAQEYADIIYKIFNLPVSVDDSNMIIALAGLSKKEFLHKPIPDELIFTETTGIAAITASDTIPFSQALIETINLASGNKIRFLILARPGSDIGEAEKKSLQAAATFLSRWLEKSN